MYGFRKVDPDRWEFANEGFLGGQRHLLKTIKRRRNVTQSIQQQGGACIEVGKYGLEGEIERLRRDCNLLMTEVVKLRQQQQFSREQLITMEARLQSTERKQQQMMAFLARALSNPAFLQSLIHQNEGGRLLKGIEIGRKRSLMARTSTDDIQEEVVSAAMERTQVVNNLTPEQEESFATMESEMETFFSAALDDESSSDVKERSEPNPIPSANGAHFGNVGDLTWEELLHEDFISSPEEKDGLMDDQHEADVPMDDLVRKSSNWGEDIRNLISEMGFLLSNSKPHIPWNCIYADLMTKGRFKQRGDHFYRDNYESRHFLCWKPNYASILCKSSVIPLPLSSAPETGVVEVHREEEAGLSSNRNSELGLDAERVPCPNMGGFAEILVVILFFLTLTERWSSDDLWQVSLRVFTRVFGGGVLASDAAVLLASSIINLFSHGFAAIHLSNQLQLFLLISKLLTEFAEMLVLASELGVDLNCCTKSEQKDFSQTVQSSLHIKGKKFEHGQRHVKLVSRVQPQFVVHRAISEQPALQQTFSHSEP
ncbi:hypothetical protein Cgig2_011443 [Carnegiea gigantea]|uniref:Uncharacterized protein n=1 Tax=Carnegiea gigantea TaxID=171969 RepID=A0A9Q1KSW6_9CARY|nr:hypothetical protein Cgig2_011443 [Carnegiea gigantea]